MTPLKKEIENALNLTPQSVEARGPLRLNVEAFNSLQLQTFQTTDTDSSRKNEQASIVMATSARPKHFKRTLKKSAEGDGGRPMSSHRVTTLT